MTQFLRPHTLFIIALLLTPFIAKATDRCAPSQCIDVNQWDIRLAIGLGQKSNPISHYDDIPIYLIPSIAYYGERWFFDNGNIGYTLDDSQDYTINISTSYGEDSGYFLRWDPSNIFVNSTNNIQGGSSVMAVEPSEDIVLEQSQLKHRHFTLLGGVDVYLYTQAGSIKFSLARDLFNVHQGTQAQVQWSYNMQVSRWQLELAAALDWKSADLVRYYYGVRESENQYWNQAYRPTSTVNKWIEMKVRYLLNQSWELLAAYRYTRLGAEINASPLVKENSSNTLFIGAAYRF